MRVTAIMATCGRHTCSERSLRFFLDQDYEGLHDLIIYQNSEHNQTLGDFPLPDNKTITLINNNIDYRTGEKFETLGAIYNNVLTDIPADSDIVIFWDDDDIFLPQHISRGVDGLIRGYKTFGKNYLAYKPFHSYFRTSHGISLAHNTLEPSIFVNADFLKDVGFYDITSRQHLKWVEELVRRGAVYQDAAGEPTLCYNWGDHDLYTYKTSGNPDLEVAFNEYRKHSQDHGDGVIDPMSQVRVQDLYNLFNNN